MCRADTDWLLEDDPGDTLQQWGCGQGAVVGPIIQRTREKSLCVKLSKSGLLPLQEIGSAEEKTGKTMTMKQLVS